MKCRICGQSCDMQKSVISNGKIIDGCEKCIDTAIRTGGHAAKFYRDAQKVQYRKDLTQQWEPTYAKAFGVDAAREAGWSDEQIRKYG